MKTGQLSLFLLAVTALVLPGCGDTIRVPESDETPPSVVLTASGLRGDVVTVGPDDADAERRVEGTETIELTARATDDDGGVRRLTLSGVLHVFCSDNRQPGEPVHVEEPITEEETGTEDVGDEAPTARTVSRTIAPEDLPPLCPPNAAFVRSEGEFTAEGENFHGSVVETARFVYVQPGS